MAFVKAIDDVPTESTALAKQVFGMAEKRIGEVPLVEPAEEVRALLLRLCCAVLARNSAETFGNEVRGHSPGNTMPSSAERSVDFGFRRYILLSLVM